MRNFDQVLYAKIGIVNQVLKDYFLQITSKSVVSGITTLQIKTSTEELLNY